MKVPGLFSGNEKTIPFARISSVDIDCPLVGYSTIIIETTGEGNIQAHGFTKAEVMRMKAMILEKKPPLLAGAAGATGASARGATMGAGWSGVMPLTAASILTGLASAACADGGW